MLMNLTTPGDGVKTINIWFRDSVGNTNPEGSPFSDTIILDTTAPTNGLLITTEGGDIVLNWPGFSDGSGSGIASYKLVKSDTAPPADCSGSAIYTGSDTSYTDTAVTPGTTYYYRVCAIDNVTNTSSGVTTSGTAGQPAVRIERTPAVPYTAIQTAYNSAQAADLIQLRETGFLEQLVFNRGIAVTLQGAYNPTYSSVLSDAYSDIYGSLTVSDGTVTIGAVIVW
jgi:hypothetical protein